MSNIGSRVDFLVIRDRKSHQNSMLGTTRTMVNTDVFVRFRFFMASPVLHDFGQLSGIILERFCDLLDTIAWIFKVVWKHTNS